jgi:prophage antirepressor-like protein
MVEDEPWFNSIDLCKALGFSSKQARNQAFTTHVHDVDKAKFETLISEVQANKNIDLDGSVCKNPP